MTGPFDRILLSQSVQAHVANLPAVERQIVLSGLIEFREGSLEATDLMFQPLAPRRALLGIGGHRFLCELDSSERRVLVLAVIS